MKARPITKFGKIQLGKIPVVSFLPSHFNTWTDLLNLFLAIIVGILGAKGTFAVLFS